MHLIDKSKHVLIDEAILDASSTHSSQEFGYFSICKRYRFANWSPNDPDEPINFVEKVYSNNFLEEAIVNTLEQELKNGMNRDCWISQHTYKKRRRVSKYLSSFGSGFVDLDYYKNPKLSHLDENEVITLVLKALDFHRIPLPSYIVSSGRGLQVKWIFTNQISHFAYEILAAALRWLICEYLSEFEADIAAMMPTQLLRLVGTKNQAGGIVRIAWKNMSNGSFATYDFNCWCKSVLPFTREEVNNFKEKVALYKKWDKENARNREEAKESGLLVGVYKATSSQNQNDNTKEIWQRRLALIEWGIESKGWAETGVPDGNKRYKIFFLAVNAIAWICRSNPEKTKTAVFEWSRKHIKTYCERRSHENYDLFATRILQRNLYQYTESNFKKNLVELFGEEAFKRKKSDDQRGATDVNTGVMGFSVMSRLSLCQYVRETKHRQSESAKRTNQIKKSEVEPVKDLAIKLRQQGRSVCSIAIELNRTKGTISKWVRDCGVPLETSEGGNSEI